MVLHCERRGGRLVLELFPSSLRFFQIDVLEHGLRSLAYAAVLVSWFPTVLLALSVPVQTAECISIALVQFKNILENGRISC